MQADTTNRPAPGLPAAGLGADNAAADDVPPDLRQAGAVVEKTIEYLLEQNLGEMAIASALLGGSIGLLARRMGDRAILHILDNAARSIRAGELRAPAPS